MKYSYIRAWGRHMGSRGYYIDTQVERANETNAPDRATYEKYANDGSGRTGEWSTVDDILNPMLKESIERAAERYK